MPQSPGFVAEASRRQDKKHVGQRAGLTSSVESKVWGPAEDRACIKAGIPISQSSCRVGGAMWNTLHGPQLTRNLARTGGWLLRALLAVRWDGRTGRICCSRLAVRRQKPEQAESVQLVKAIYTMYKLVNQSLGWQRPHQVQAPQQGGGSRGKGRLVQHLLGTRGGRGRKCRWRLPIQKRGENSLNNGTKLRLSPEKPPKASGWGRDRSAVSAVDWGISSSVSFVYCSS